MAWTFDPSAWTTATSPSVADFQHVATDLHTRGGAVDGGGYGRANTGYVKFVAGDLPGVTYTVSAASWSGGFATYTIGTHGILAGQVVSIASITPSGYNATSGVVTSVASTTITIAVTSNPGAYSSGGTVTLSATAAASGMLALNPYAPMAYPGLGSGFLPSSALAGKINSKALSNGANNDIDPGLFKTVYITGPSGAFSVSGFSGGFEGRVIDIINQTGQTGSIKNSSGSTSANQIITRTGADIASFTYASLLYLGSVTAKWIVRFSS